MSDDSAATGARLEIERFQALRGSTFSMRRGKDLREIELVEVRDLGRRPTPQGPLSCYALLFRHQGARGYVPQGTFDLEHAQLGALPEVFLVPVGPDGQGMLYEAVFN